MNAIMQAVKAKVDKLDHAGSSLLAELPSFGWEDARPARTPSSTDSLALAGLMDQLQTPEKARIPVDFVLRYHQWYGACLAVAEANMPSRLEELRRVHEGNIKANDAGLSWLLEAGEMSFVGQTTIAAKVVQIRSIVGSVPNC